VVSAAAHLRPPPTMRIFHLQPKPGRRPPDRGVPASIKCRLPCLRTPPHLPAWRLLGLGPLLRTRERRLSSSAAGLGLSSPPQAVPKLRRLHLHSAGLRLPRHARGAAGGQPHPARGRRRLAPCAAARQLGAEHCRRPAALGDVADPRAQQGAPRYTPLASLHAPYPYLASPRARRTGWRRRSRRGGRTTRRTRSRS
jgi:hypothetical protein